MQHDSPQSHQISHSAAEILFPCLTKCSFPHKTHRWKATSGLFMLLRRRACDNGCGQASVPRSADGVGVTLTSADEKQAEQDVAMDSDTNTPHLHNDAGKAANVMMGCDYYVWESLNVMWPDILQLEKISLLWVPLGRMLRSSNAFNVCLITSISCALVSCFFGLIRFEQSIKTKKSHTFCCGLIPNCTELGKQTLLECLLLLAKDSIITQFYLSSHQYFISKCVFSIKLSSSEPTKPNSFCLFIIHAAPAWMAELLQNTLSY